MRSQLPKSEAQRRCRRGKALQPKQKQKTRRSLKRRERAYVVSVIPNYEGLEQKRKRDLLNAVNSTPVDIELATEAKFQGTQEARGLQFLASRNDAGQWLIWA